MPKLICLMPTYNKEDTLGRAIESVMMQKADFDYKLIILDDCSTDNSNKIASEYKQKFPEKVEIVRNETNLKLLHSIINGYKLLKGSDYFCVLDADDWYTYDKKFADAVEFLDKHKKYSMYMANITLKKEDGETLWYSGNKKTLDFGFKERKADKGFFVQTTGVIYRNVYFKTGENKEFDKILNYKFPQTFRSDGHRFEWYLHWGKAHFVNHVESVYNYNMSGIWSGMPLCEQELHGAKSMYCYAKFFPKDKDYYYSLCKESFKTAMKNFAKEPPEVFCRNEDAIKFLYQYLYLEEDIKFFKFLKFLIRIIPFKYFRKLLRRSF